MNQTRQPTKERIREWLRDRQLNPGPPPPIEQIQSELAWGRQANISELGWDLQIQPFLTSKHEALP